MIENLPHFHSHMNLLAAILLFFGWRAIKNKNEDLHKKIMCSAFICSSLFLTSYLIYHFNVGSRTFPDIGIIKTIYLVILIPHIILATLMVPMILATFYFAFKDMRMQHLKLAKITLPIWFYVSVTGYVVYVMQLICL